ncbi:MAG: tetratricopeptide repeat protein [Alphaproteobacteria bacterium]|nr:tetratricopeptide repeat protein [Alphaproteobacteria bacterium]
MFADVVGYSRLMRANEERTLVDLQAHLSELVEPVVARFGGRVVKKVGDGLLAEFGSAVEAVRAAVDMQRGMSTRNAGVPADRRQTFRIGLHLGDIIAVDDDVFGDAVNVAARLQALAGPGAVMLSSSVYEQARDKLSLRYRDLGRRTVKNIDRPVRLYVLDAAALSAPAATGRTPAARRRIAAIVAVAAAVVVILTGAAVYFSGRVVPLDAPIDSARSPANAGPMVAVLVFANQSGDPAQDYFSDGLTEDITRAPGRFRQMTVLAYGAVLPFRGKDLPLAEIGRTLKARYLVGGSVRRMGSRVRVAVQLNDSASGAQLWAELYDDELSDIFAVQERIARRIAGSLASNLQQLALQQSLRKPTDNLDAYDLVLRGRAAAATATRAGNRAARETLERAIQLAPGYAVAYAELADAYFQRASFGWSEFAQQDVEMAIQLAHKAIGLDDDCEQAHGLLARAYVATQRYELALAESARALRINPSNADVLLARAAVLLWTGRIEESVASAELAERLNVNIGPEPSLNFGLAYLLSGRYAQAVALLEAARNRYPAYPLLDFPLAGAYAELGRMAEATAALERGQRKNPLLDPASFGSRFQDPALQRRVEASLRKAGLN